MAHRLPCSELDSEDQGEGSRGTRPREPGEALPETDADRSGSQDRGDRQAAISGLQAEVCGGEALAKGADQGER